MDTAKWPQEFVVKPMNEIVTNNTSLKHPNPATAQLEKKARPEKDQALNCPRCNSVNTKFCYYNNYSLTQPRYFCKNCRRYWTEGGSLRNIPVGGGVRKNKRSSSSSSNSNSTSPSSSSSSKKPLLLNTPPPSLPQVNPKIGENTHEAAAKVQDLVFSQGLGNTQEVKDLNMAFSQGFGIGHHHHNIPEFLQGLPSNMKNDSLVSTSSALELLGISNSSTSSTSLPTFIPYPNVHDSSVYNASAASGFGLSYPQFQEFMRPALGFSLSGGYGGDPLHQQQGSSGTNNGRPLLPFESLKLPVSSSSTNSGGNGNDHHSDHEQEKEEGEADHSAGFWSGMLSAGASAASGGAGGSWQ